MAVRFAARWSLPLATLVLLVLTLPASAAPTEWSVSGYVQGRYTETLGELQPTPPATEPIDPVGTFEIRRAYLYARVKVDERIGAAILFNGVPSTSLLEAYGDYTVKPFSTRLGLSRIPFGYEVPLSSSRLITLERSKVATDLLVPFTFDKGLFWYYQPGQGPNLALALTNGTPPNVPTDTNERKDFIGRLSHAIPGGEIGLSMYQGNNPTNNQTMDRTGIDLETKQGPVTLLSEVIAGRDGTTDSLGGYVTLAYQKDGTPSQPYIRFDTFDRDDAVPDDVYNRVTVGYNHYLAPGTRVTLEYESINDEQEPDLNGRITTQYQVSF